MKKWKLKEEEDIDASIINLKEISGVINDKIVQLLSGRGFNSKRKIEKFFNPDYKRDLLDPFLFSQMDKVVRRIQKAKKDKETVAVFGDYDADGITSSLILTEALTGLGISSIVYLPDKNKEGYGLNLNAIGEFKVKGIKLVITVDCGISNRKEIAAAKERGIDIIVIDHHHVPPELPDAIAIINAQMFDSGYPFSQLAGVGTAFKVVQALYQKLAPKKQEQIKWMLDLVAIGTVADCVPIFKENRILVKYGLIVLSKTRRIGLQELFSAGRIMIDENNPADTYKISFQIAPRINAAGRMNHANVAYGLIKETDRVKARDLALELEKNNSQRQKVTNFIVEEVRKLVQKKFKDKKFIHATSPHYSLGVVGLAAGKIADEFNKPTVIFQRKEGKCHGSFRSIPQVNIVSAIEKCKDLLIKYGGHPQAAGVTVPLENLDIFCKKMDSIIGKQLEGKDITPEIEIDLELHPHDLSDEFIQELKKFEPYGIGNEEPVFLIKNLEIHNLKMVGNGDKHLKLVLKTLTDPVQFFDAIGFNHSESFQGLKIGARVEVVFNLHENEWNGNKSLQMRIIDLKVMKKKTVINK